MTFWIGFLTGAFVINMIGILLEMPPEKAKQNLREWLEFFK